MPETHSEIIAIQTDNTCKTLIKNNISSNCPTPDEIDILFPNDRCSLSGNKCLEYYRFDNAHRYFIEPYYELQQRVKTIVIRADFNEYLYPQNKGYNKTEHTVTYGLGRYVQNCHSAFIDSAQWFTLLGDTIWYMLNDCKPGYTHHTEKRIQHLNKTNHDIATSYKWKLEQWQKQAINNCGFKLCLYNDNQTSPP